MIYQTIIIGKGLVGSAAAKYISATHNKVAIIGPNEPAENEQPIVYASHYDQARVQRVIGKDEVWTKLDMESVAAYAAIEKQTGIQFYKQVGCLYVQPTGADAYLNNAASIANKYNLPYKYYNHAAAISADYPAYHFPATSQGLVETTNAGLINPRLLIQAQLSIFEQQNGTIINDTVLKLTHHNGVFEITTSHKEIYQAEQVLIATGSFINYLDILPKQLSLQTKNEIIILAQVHENIAAQLANLPSLLYEIENHELDGIYLIQPVRYPDGNYYIKMGCNMPEDRYFNNLEQVQAWFTTGNSEQFKQRMLAALQLILPNVPILNTITKKCIISRTAHGRPYIGATGPQGLFVAGGCNGYSAMCSNAIGHTAATLMLTGQLPQGYAPSHFELVYA
jgi:glycine/D-amino acid oxidase-like deaminating enzyme